MASSASLVSAPIRGSIPTSGNKPLEPLYALSVSEYVNRYENSMHSIARNFTLKLRIVSSVILGAFTDQLCTLHCFTSQQLGSNTFKSWDAETLISAHGATSSSA
ncbi:uncharacterized protein FFMR_04494 [Fusarium fujikuroi]|nr:uncharacterized protein FFMR_04494 [Fusarium fujikuroi]